MFRIWDQRKRKGIGMYILDDNRLDSFLGYCMLFLIDLFFIRRLKIAGIKEETIIKIASLESIQNELKDIQGVVK